MVIKYFNPIFWWQKRYSLKNRFKELPDDLRWKIIYPFINSGYVYNPDFNAILRIKDKHKNKIGILIGNGPSVQFSDLEKMNDFISFACNRIHLAYENFGFRPNYVLSSDEQVINDFGQDIIDNNEKCFLISKRRPVIVGNFIWFKLKNGRPFVFSKNPTYQIMSSGGTLVSAIQIGYYMGIRKFILYGVDHDFKYDKIKSAGYVNAQGEGNHFIKNYRSGKPWQAPVFDLVEEAFVKSDRILREENGYLINATRGGKLEVLERKNFDDILRDSTIK